jgi:small conductance mechanosensitive channel
MIHAQIEPTVTRFILHISHFILMLVVVIIALGQLGIQTTSLLAVLSAAGLAIGLALQGSLANLAAGLLLIIFRPFKQGDFIGAAGVEGTVQDVQILATTLHTADNLRLIVPNAKITDGIITNYSVTPTRRVDFTIGVSYEDNLQQVKQVLTTLITENPDILQEPAPFIGVSELGDSSINVLIRVWVLQANLRQVRFGVPEQIKLTFDQHGLTLPYPQHTVHLQNVTGSAQQQAGRELQI